MVSTIPDGDMDPPSNDALSNYRPVLGKYGLFFDEFFSPALGQNYRIITIDESNEERFAGRFIGNGDSREEYHCDAVIVCGANIPVAFRVGDCPIVLVVGQSFEEQTIMALVHAGRAELQAEVLKNSCGSMVSDYPATSSSATAYVFPHICKHCYFASICGSGHQRKSRKLFGIFQWPLSSRPHGVAKASAREGRYSALFDGSFPLHCRNFPCLCQPAPARHEKIQGIVLSLQIFSPRSSGGTFRGRCKDSSKGQRRRQGF